jgi:hypothetical protein
MKRINRDIFDRITLNASLQRLGVVELDERLEFSPLLVEGGLQDTDGGTPTACCVCKIPDDDLNLPDIRIFDPANGGDGSTGPTGGGLIR